MNARKQWFAVIILILLLDAVSLALSGLAANAVSSEQNPFAVSQLFRNALLGEEVYVRGRISEMLPEYKAKSGYNYQQFFISDGEDSIKVFCSQKYGKADVGEGDEIVASGKFQKYYDAFEINGFCREIKVL
jgi:hypothetical protein